MLMAITPTRVLADVHVEVWDHKGLGVTYCTIFLLDIRYSREGSSDKHLLWWNRESLFTRPPIHQFIHPCLLTCLLTITNLSGSRVMCWRKGPALPNSFHLPTMDVREQKLIELEVGISIAMWANLEQN